MSAAYELRIRGRLSPELLADFDELTLLDVETVETVLYGAVEDQAALHGLLRRIEALGLDLVGLRGLPPLPPLAPDDRR